MLTNERIFCNDCGDWVSFEQLKWIGDIEGGYNGETYGHGCKRKPSPLYQKRSSKKE